MTSFSGLFKLQTTQDLLEKLRHDHHRLKRSPLDSYAAFDFCVTAYHLLDWQHPSDSKKRSQVERDNIILQVLSHLANGSKHFQATRSKHISVKGTKVQQGGFDSNVFDSGVFDVGELRIELQGEAAKYFGAPSIGVLRLADDTLSFWGSYR
jgi:hypothetical protein